jgi:hypothetical protein
MPPPGYGLRSPGYTTTPSVARQALAGARDRLERAIARGGYYKKSYGEAWRATLLWFAKHERHQLLLRHHAIGAAGGNKTAARRVAYLLIAGRWLEMKHHYRAIVDHQEMMKRKRHRYTGKPLAKTTIHQRQAKLASMLIPLDAMLNDLVTLPTPSYREWRQMTGG